MKIVTSTDRTKPVSEQTSSGEDYSGLLALAKSVIDAKKEYALVKEQEVTKRLAISSDLNKYLVSISYKRELLERHLENEFSLRKESIAEILSRLDSAIESNQESTAAAALNAIQGIVAANPLKGISEVSKFFDSGYGTLEI